jgi:hypothetical protein
MQSEVRQLTAEEILSEYHRQLLSPSAVRYTSQSGSGWGAAMQRKFGSPTKTLLVAHAFYSRTFLPLNPNWRRQDSWSYFRAMGKRDTRLSMILDTSPTAP